MSSAAGPDTATGPDRPPQERPGTFSSLKIRNYRLFATGAVISNTGTWMSRIAQDWLVLSITGSSFAVGITTALQFLPMLLFGLYGGVIADRYPKRKLLLCTQAALGVLGLALAVLTLSGVVQVWHVYAIAFLLGVVTVVDNPTRQTFVVEMVGPSVVRNAVSLNAANFQAARLIGPAVAGVLITAVGSGWAFLINGVSFVAPLTGLLLMRTSELHKIDRAPRGRGQLREGLRYVAGKPELIWPIVLVGFIGTFGFNFPIWLSAFANKVFVGGAGTYGLFNSLMAGGSLIGALLTARRTRTRLRKLVGFALVFAALELLVSVAPSLWLFALLLVPVGVFGMTFNTAANTSVQLATDPMMRGRVMSLYMMVFAGGTPIGGPLMGWVTDTYGARMGFLSGGLISAAGAVFVGVVLARAAGLRLRVDLRARRGAGPLISFVPRAGAPASTAAATGPAAEAAAAPAAASDSAPETGGPAGGDAAPQGAESAADGAEAADRTGHGRALPGTPGARPAVAEGAAAIGGATPDDGRSQEPTGRSRTGARSAGDRAAGATPDPGRGQDRGQGPEQAGKPGPEHGTGPARRPGRAQDRPVSTVGTTPASSGDRLTSAR